jgi:drug/metabolite transporter (DMT)-like permease
VTLRKYLVLIGVTVFSAIGDTLLSRGMKQVGSIPAGHAFHVLLTIFHPWVALGILFLLAFFACYMTALSWADLTYVLPATSLGYVLLAVIAKYQLHEQITTARWLGILLITMGVGFVAGGPELTHHHAHTATADSHSPAGSPARADSHVPRTAAEKVRETVSTRSAP